MEAGKLYPSTGCWIDGHWGIYGITRLIEIAQDYGFEISDDDETAIQAYKDHKSVFFDTLGEQYGALEWTINVADDAENWLNVNMAEPEFIYGWLDGEFYYMHESWWEDEEYIDNEGDYELPEEFEPYFSDEPINWDQSGESPDPYWYM